MKIKSVEPSAQGAQITVYLDTGDKFSFRLCELSALSLSRELETNIGMDVDAELYEKFADAAERLSCIKYAQYVLGFGDKSERKLTEKLRLKGYSETAQNEAISVLKKNGFINDESLCRRKLAQLYESKLFGPYRLRRELYSKGFSAADIDSALDECGIDFDEGLHSLLQRLTAKTGVPQDREGQRKLSSKLTAYGYAYDEIAEAIEDIGKA